MIIFYKNRGETPLEALTRLREESPSLFGEKLSYAGRLDPMAEGLLLVLVGKEENLQREKYLNLDKTYQTEILLGLSTDSSDLLGKIDSALGCEKDFLGYELEKTLDSFKGKHEQKYPDFSSKTFKGRPLFSYARSGKGVPEIIHDTELFEIKILEQRNTDILSVYNVARMEISKVNGDFRQKEIIESYEKYLELNLKFKIISLELKVSSGFYVRQFAKDFGDKLGFPALTFSIKRIKIGNYDMAGDF